MPGLKVKRDGFDVLAEAQAIRAEIHTVANGLACIQTANFDRLRQATGGFDTEIGEDGMPRLDVRDSEHFLTPALASFVDLVGVGCAPVVGRRQFEFPVRFGCLSHGAKRMGIGHVSSNEQFFTFIAPHLYLRC